MTPEEYLICLGTPSTSGTTSSPDSTIDIGIPDVQCNFATMNNTEYQQCLCTIHGLCSTGTNPDSFLTPRPISTSSPTCNIATMTIEQYQQCLRNSGNAGGSNGGANGGSNGGSSNGGFSIAGSGETCSTNSVCNDGPECQKHKAVQAFLIIAILAGVAAVICGILYLIGSSDTMSLIGCFIATVSGVAGLISIAIVGAMGSSSFDFAYGFYLHIIATLFVFISAVVLYVSHGQRGSKVLTNTTYRV